ncbi:MAG: bifunctional diaminohydroxyphosphoribosylaminopyrimidine deaminase/5-amino-6-(5-phosphoribosylamino)uracil reductase RibD [Pseudomonadota bacterium]|nr:bifunctional diaminohydroxyphosphoribosylaminopyrimidine deaminase/5-amino-6-(5-phosphoribosylamino)uracil reductase RibD [Pseudomonadota bacterium]
MIYDEIHKGYMEVAFQEARKGIFSAAPNPSVGCVIVKDGNIVSRGFHARHGSDHAEIVALKKAGEKANGSYCYVTLEPCNHHGRTGPCTEALIASRVKAVIAAIRDPNSNVKGDGAKRLRKAGIDVLLDVETKYAEQFYKNYLFKVRNNRPLVKVKIGMSLDACSAMSSGESKWITNQESREDVQFLRAESCVILTGVGTVLEDNPSLNVRNPKIEIHGRQPRRIVLDSRLSIDKKAKIINDGGNTTLFTCSQNRSLITSFEKMGCGVEVLASKNNRVDLCSVFHRINKMDVNQVLVEAGSFLTSNILSSTYWDELVLYIAPKIMGKDARSAIQVSSPEYLERVTKLELIDSSFFGTDVRLTYKKL